MNTEQPPEGISGPPPGKRPFRIRIGSERDDETAGPPAAPEDIGDEEEGTGGTAAAEQFTAPPRPAGRGLPPPRVESIPADVEAEINAALEGVSLDQIFAHGELGSKASELAIDQRLVATVVKVYRDSIFFSLPGRHEGVASIKQLAEIPAVGTALEVVVTRFNADEGLYELRMPGAAVDVDDWSDLAEGMTVGARITGHNSGGLECAVGGIRGFIPASQVALYREEDLAQFVDQKLPCVVIEANERKRNLVLSHRAVLEREKQQARQQLLESLETGQVLEGVVRSLRDFGAFVDLGGLDGLIHVSQLSWDRIAHPRDVLEEGQRVKVRIEKVDPTTGKISLSYRDLLDNPWDTIETKYPVHSIVTGTVSKIMDFGAFVRLDAGLEGLIHISELAHHRVHRVDSVVSEGQEVQVKVLGIDRQNQRIRLSLKAAQASAVTHNAAGEEAAEDETEPTKLAQPQRTKALKGGTERRSGGEQFGLDW
jgi:small subunit ribosomal protein S1